MEKKYSHHTKRGELNLIGIIAKYKDPSDTETEIYENAIFPNILQNVPAYDYTGINILLLKRLFEDIKKENLISNTDFKDAVEPLITSPLEAYNLDAFGDDASLWGAWYKTEDEEDAYGSLTPRTFSTEEYSLLKELLLREDSPGEAIAYALSIFAGLSVTEAMRARYKDLSPLGTGGQLHTMGAFPMFRNPTDFDARPRCIPLPDDLYHLLMKRGEAAKQRGFLGDTGDLHLSCKGYDIDTPCRIRELSRYARDVLRIGLDMEEKRASFVTGALLSEPLLFAAERSFAYYMGRASYATRLYGLGVDVPTVQYLMGHVAEEPTTVTEEMLLRTHLSIKDL